MRKSELRPWANALLLFGVLASNTIYRTSIGGEGTIYARLSFVVAVVFMLVNRRFNPRLAAAFALPIVFLALSVMVNLSTLGGGSLRSALLTATGYALLTLKPMPLDQTRLRKLVVLYLVVCLVLSLYVTLSIGAGALITGNRNFNINPNGASLFFFSCLTLSLVFATGALRMLLAIAFSLLIVTTGSRAGLMMGGLLLAGFVLMSTDIARRPFWRSPFARRRIAWALGLAMVPVLAARTFPAAVEYAVSRFAVGGLTLGSVSGEEGRDMKWGNALYVSQQSLRSIVVGHGPATASDLIDSGTHSSYVEAFLSVGWPFMLLTVLAVMFVCLYHFRHGQKDFLLYGIAILVYGGIETVLFNGMGSIWLVFIFLSLYYRSTGGAARVANSRHVPRRS